MFGNLYLNKHYPLYDFDDVTYVKVNKEIYDRYESKASLPNATTEEILKNISERFKNINARRTDVYGNYYVKFERLETLNFIFSTVMSIIFVTCIFSFVPAIALIIDRIKTVNKDYIRTSKGIETANNAYGLKNYLEKYSIMKERTAEQVVLYEYYLVYAVSLDVNTKIENDIINKFIDLQLN